MNHLRFLRYVDEVARAGSVRQAAERLHVAPSAVIRRIQDLEHELGTPIFERLPRGMRLTAAGELFVAYIRQRHADLEPIATWEQKLMVMMHRSHPLARHPEVRLRDCVNYPLALPGPDLGGRQLLERFLARTSLRFRGVLESNAFELLRGYLHHDQAISFQIAVGAVTDGDELVIRDIADRGFPRGHLVLAHLRGRQLPVVAHAFANHLQRQLNAGALPLTAPRPAAASH